MARDKLLFQVELIPPSASNVKSVSQAIDKLTQSQKEYNDTTKKGGKNIDEQKQSYKKFRQEIRKIKTSVGEAENQARFFDAANEDAIKTIQTEANQLDKLRAEITSANLAEEDRIRLLDKLQTRMRSVQLSQQKVRTGWKGMSHATKQGNQLMLSTGRILQDLPYGFIGISNNIEELALQFRRATDDGSGFTGALSKMKTSFLGSGGILFLLGSALPFALTVAQNGFVGFKDLLGSSSSEAKDLKGDLKELVDSVASLRKAQGDDPLGIRGLEGRVQGLDKLLSNFQGVIDKQERINQLERSHAQSSYYGSRVVERTTDNLQKIIDKQLDQFGINERQLRKLQDQKQALKDQLAIRRAMVQADPVLEFKKEQFDRANRLIERFELGIRSFQKEVAPGFDKTFDTIEQLRKEEEKLAKQQFELQRSIEQGTASEDTLAKLRVTSNVLSKVREKLEEIPEKPSIAPEFEDLPVFEADIETDIGISFGEAADFGKEMEKRLESMSKQRLKFLMESRKQAFDIRKSLSSDIMALHMSTQRQLTQIEERAAELGLENHRVVENLKTEVTRQAAEKRRQLELQKERQLQQAKMGVVKQSAAFIGSVNKALAKKSKAVALIELAIQKGLKIAEVWTEAQQKSGELQMESQVASAKATAAFLAGNPLKGSQYTAAATALSSQIATVQSTAAQTTGLIAATGLMEGIGQFTGGGGGASGGGGGSASGGGGGASGGGGGSDRPLGFSGEEGIDRTRRSTRGFTPVNPRSTTIVVNVDNKVDEKGINTLVERGKRKKHGKLIFQKSIPQD